MKLASLVIASSLAATLAWANAQSAAAYPEGQIKLLVGFAAGGPSDLVARTFASEAGKGLGRTIIVENRPGANAVLATEAVAGSKPNGLTLLAAATNHTMIPALYGARVKFDAAKSFIPVCTLASSATVLVVGPSLPVKAVADYLKRAGAKPNAVSYASPGIGSSPHLATESFTKLTGTTMVHVPYKGAAPAVNDLLAGQVDSSFATLGSVLPYIKSGKLIALAVASRERSALLPKVPTFDEAGVHGYVVDTWFGLLAPTGTPPAVIAALQERAENYGKQPAVRAQLESAGLEPLTRCGADFAGEIDSEIKMYGEQAKRLGLKAD